MTSFSQLKINHAGIISVSSIPDILRYKIFNKQSAPDLGDYSLYVIDINNAGYDYMYFGTIIITSPRSYINENSRRGYLSIVNLWNGDISWVCDLSDMIVHF